MSSKVKHFVIPMTKTESGDGALVFFDEASVCVVDCSKYPKIINNFIEVLVEQYGRTVDAANDLLDAANSRSRAVVFCGAHVPFDVLEIFFLALLEEFNRLRNKSLTFESFASLVRDAIFQEVQAKDLIEILSRCDREIGFAELEYLYGYKMVSLGEFLYKSKALFDICSSVLSGKVLRDEWKQREIKLICYTNSYALKHGNFILDKLAESDSLIFTIKNSAEQQHLAAEVNALDSLEDLVRVLYSIERPLAQRGFRVEKIVSPDIACNHAALKMLAHSSGSIVVHINESPCQYGTVESYVHSLAQDLTFPSLRLDYDARLADVLKRDDLTFVFAAIGPGANGASSLPSPLARQLSKRRKVSFIITAHAENSMAVRSIWNLVGVIQHAGMHEDANILCIIDKGTDETKRSIRNFKKMLNLNLLQIHEVEFGDLSSSRNYAIEVANCNYVSIHDADDLISLDWCERLHSDSDGFLTNGRIFHPKVNLYFGQGERIMWSPCMVDDHETIRWSSLMVDNFWTSCSAGPLEIYRESPYRCIDKTTGTGYEDWSWNIGLIEKGIIHRAIPDTTLFVRLKPAEMSLNKDSQNSFLLPVMSESFLNRIRAGFVI